MQEVEQIILETLPKEITDAIYIFGSYNTPYFDESTSDIDVGWYTNSEIDWFEAMEYRELLEKKLDRQVDLLVNEKTRVNVACNILSGKPIGEMSEEFCEWFDRFLEYAKEEMAFLQAVRREREDIV